MYHFTLHIDGQQARWIHYKKKKNTQLCRIWYLLGQLSVMLLANRFKGSHGLWFPIKLVRKAESVGSHPSTFALCLSLFSGDIINTCPGREAWGHRPHAKQGHPERWQGQGYLTASSHCHASAGRPRSRFLSVTSKLLSGPLSDNQVFITTCQMQSWYQFVYHSVLIYDLWAVFI